MGASERIWPWTFSEFGLQEEEEEEEEESLGDLAD